MNMSEDKIKRLKSIADLRDSGALTESEFQELKSKILSETSSQTNEKLSFSNYKEHLNGKTVVIGGVIGVIILILIMFVFSLGDSDHARAYVEGHYTAAELCWKGAFHNGDSTISISGCGAEVFYCSDKGSCSINAQKDEDNSHELCVRINDKSACTTAGYGVAQVDY